MVDAQNPFPVGDDPLRNGEGVLGPPDSAVADAEEATGSEGVGVIGTLNSFLVGDDPFGEGVLDPPGSAVGGSTRSRGHHQQR